MPAPRLDIDDSARSVQPWERQIGEPVKAHAAFMIYRELGIGRTIVRAYKIYRQRQDVARASAGEAISDTQMDHPNAPRRWTEWSSRYRWVERCALYDAHLEAERRNQQEAAQVDRLAEHLDRQRTMSVALHNLSLAMLRIAAWKLNPASGPEPTGSNECERGKLPLWLATAAKLAALSREQEQEALGLDDIMGTLNGQAS